MAMSLFLYIAALLAIVLGAAHSFLGERYILSRLFRRENLPKLFGSTEFTTQTLRFTWHLTTLAWWGFAALFLLLAQGKLTPSNTALVLACTFLASGLLPLFFTRGKHWSWLILFVVGGIAIVAAGV